MGVKIKVILAYYGFRDIKEVMGEDGGMQCGIWVMNTDSHFQFFPQLAQIKHITHMGHPLTIFKAVS